jgi:hypothetical protein
MAVEVATAYVTLLPSARGFEAAMKSQLSGVGTSGGKSLSDSVGNELTKSTKSGSLSKATKFLGTAFGGSLVGSFLGAGGAANAINLVAKTIGGFISEAQDAQKVASETANVIKSTGGAAGVSAKQVDQLATALSLKSGVDDEVIASGENVLLTFTKVTNQVGAGNDVFNQASAVALDMSSALGTDLQGSVIQVGKALNDPIKGITALQRVGVSFTEQQKEQIKTLVQSGDTLGAQKIILGELNTEFGGAAEAGATSSAKLSVAWGNIQEQIGTALLPAFNAIADWLVKSLPNAIAQFQQFVKPLQDFWQKYGDQIKAVLSFLFKWVTTEIKIFVTAVRVEWNVLSAIVTFLNNFVVQPIISVITGLAHFLAPAFNAMVRAVRVEWNVLTAIVTFFRDNVYQPLANFAGALGDNITRAFQVAVVGIRIAWAGMSAIVSFFRDNVFNPLYSAVSTLVGALVKAFQIAVTGISAVWDRVRDVVRVPIDAVLGFYNNGIRKMWNIVVTHVGLGGLALDEVHLATGGVVPGTGNRDTVPALLTPGEFVVTKKAAKMWGPDVLAQLNDPRGTIDPAIFGYATGGTVRSAEEVQAWARQQAGKPYRFPDVGPNSYDCSGFTSALVNFALGLYPYSRRHSSGDVGGDPALVPGAGDPAKGLIIGARPPYMISSAGNFVGHTTSTIAGMNAEATPPAVRVGGAARGASALPFQYFMPKFGGLSEADKQVVNLVKSLETTEVPALGSGSWGDLLHGLVSKIPSMVHDFLIKTLPDTIKDAIISFGAPNMAGGILGALKTVLPFAEYGGRITRDGPILVGERRPEIVWGSEGEYIQANAAGGGGPLIGQIVNNRRDLTPTDLAQMIQITRLQMAS